MAVCSSRMISIQQQLSERAIELLALPEDTPCFILDVGYDLPPVVHLCCTFDWKIFVSIYVYQPLINMRVHTCMLACIIFNRNRIKCCCFLSDECSVFL